MTTNVRKWGNSLAVRIPKVFTQNLNWKEGTPIYFQQLGSSLVVSSKPLKYSLEDYVKN